LKKLRPKDHSNGKTFITNSTASAGATSSPPVWRPAARTTSVRATSATASPAIQKATPEGSVAIARETSTTAAASASRQFDHLSVKNAELWTDMQLGQLDFLSPFMSLSPTGGEEHEGEGVKRGLT
jgi:hypothetical protein